jgi:hypothetical protein
METLKSYTKGKQVMENNENSDFNYSHVAGQENIIKVSFKDEGQNKSVLLETFSDAQFRLIDRLKERAHELRPDYEKSI